MRRRSMIRWGALFLFIASLAPYARAENYARVCVTTADADSKEAVLAESSSASTGKKLVVHLDASTQCAALIVPLVEKSTRLANGWRPQMVSLPEWDEKTLPDSRAAWEWNKAGDSFELWIFFFKRDAAGLDEVQKLVTAMQNANDQVLAQQTRKLCERLAPRMSGNAQIVQGPKADATLVGGAMRGGTFPWREFAQKVALNSALEGELVLRHGR
jgi:hypothetical protein